jgi:site-specific DNA recombinase
MLKYFIYCRKSTEDEDRQMLSIDAQLSELEGIVKRENITVVNIFKETMSAKGPGRPVFNEMLRRIERGEANAIVCWKLDRLARNFDDGGKIIGLLQRGVIQEIRGFEKVYLPADNVLMIALEFGMANQYIRDLSQNIRRGIREKVRQGIFFGKAPLGYYNEPKLRTIEPHPENFTKLKRIWEKFATCEYSLTAIRKELANVGLVGERSKKPLPHSSLNNMFRNPVYYGVFAHKGELHQGKHVPMVTKQLWEDVQKALAHVGKPRKKRGEKGFLFKDFATCGSCGYCITAERHTKKSGLQFLYYRCTHKNKEMPCEQRSFVRQEKMAAEVRRNVELVVLPDEVKERFLARIETWESEGSQNTQNRITSAKAELTVLKGKLDRINNAFADGSLSLEEFKEMKNPLVPQKVELERKLVALEAAKTNRLELLRNWVLHANQAGKWAFEENWVEMKSFLKKVGSNRLLRSQTVTVEFKKPWDSLAETTVAVRGTDDISERFAKWWSRGESNP